MSSATLHFSSDHGKEGVSLLYFDTPSLACLSEEYERARINCRRANRSECYRRRPDGQRPQPNCSDVRLSWRLGGIGLASVRVWKHLVRLRLLHQAGVAEAAVAQGLQ